MYAEVTVVVDGAVEETSTFHDETLMREHIASIEEEAAGHGYLTEVYVLFHDHAPNRIDDYGCDCIQYVTTHKADYIYNEGR